VEAVSDVEPPLAPLRAVCWPSTAASGVFTSRVVHVLTSIKQSTSPPIRSIAPRQRGERNFRAPIAYPNFRKMEECVYLPRGRAGAPVPRRESAAGSTRPAIQSRP
jgi:hypothetical protein